MTYIKTERLSTQMRSLGIVLTLVGVVYSLTEGLLAIPFLVFGILLLQAHYGIQYSTEEQRIRVYFGIMGLKFGKWLTYNNAQNLQIITKTEHQNIWLLSIRRRSVSTQSTLYLSFEEHHVILAKLEKQIILNMAKKLSADLKLEIRTHD